MGKPCNAEGCENARWGKGYCKYHQHLREDKKDKGGLKRSPLRSKSTKQAKADRVYSDLRKSHLERFPVCLAQYPGCTNQATDIHHIKGRGIWYLATDTFLSTCRNCHRHIHEHPEEARKRGHLK